MFLLSRQATHAMSTGVKHLETGLYEGGGPPPLSPGPSCGRAGEKGARPPPRQRPPSIGPFLEDALGRLRRPRRRSTSRRCSWSWSVGQIKEFGPLLDEVMLNDAAHARARHGHRVGGCGCVQCLRRRNRRLCARHGVRARESRVGDRRPRGRENSRLRDGGRGRVAARLGAHDIVRIHRHATRAAARAGVWLAHDEDESAGKSGLAQFVGGRVDGAVRLNRSAASFVGCEFGEKASLHIAPRAGPTILAGNRGQSRAHFAHGKGDDSERCARCDRDAAFARYEAAAHAEARAQ